MAELEGKYIPRRDLVRGWKAASAACLCALALTTAGAAQDQQAGPPPPNTYPQASPPAAAPPAPEPGAFAAVGRWFGDAGAGISAAWQGTVAGIGGIGGQATKGATDAATNVSKGAADAATTVVKGAADVASTAARLPTSRFASGRERCAIAPNGAPDCKTAADALCKSKGFTSGNSVDFENAENCPAQVLLAGTPPEQRHCPIEYFVTRSWCQ